MAKKSKAVFVEETLLPVNAPLTAEDFTWEGPDAEKREQITRPSISYWKDAMRRLFLNKVAVVCMFALGIIILLAVVVPYVSPYTMSEQHISHINQPMFYKDAADGHVHVFGTDALGRDLFTRLWYGARTSLFIAITAVLINLAIGVIYGSFAGYIGGAVDTVMMRFIEIISAIPYLIIVILMSMVMGQGVATLIIAYSVIGWVGSARLTRGQVLSLKSQEFVVAGRALGASAGRIIGRHMVPNILSVIIVNLTLAIPSAIFTEAFLSYIGMGVPIPAASWGNLAQEGALVFQIYPNQLFLPAFFISVTMLSFNLLGDAMRDAFDPRLRR